MLPLALASVNEFRSWPKLRAAFPLPFLPVSFVLAQPALRQLLPILAAARPSRRHCRRRRHLAKQCFGSAHFLFPDSTAPNRR